MKGQIEAFVARRWSVPKRSLRIDLEPLAGGLESVVAKATVTAEGGAEDVPRRLVVKELEPGSTREADIYDLLWSRVDAPPAARMLGRDSSGGATYLFLEDVPSAGGWPWSAPGSAATVCRELARFHDRAPLDSATPFDWDYDRDLALSAQSTLDAALRLTSPTGARLWRRPGDLRRLVAALPALRRELLGAGRAIIHGDVHPGNVIVRDDGEAQQVALIDWARARVGSPLEDVASWLHSLGCWEPQARLRHDTLLRAYLDARNPSLALTPAVRRLYWFASASNGLSGAIRYHLAVLADASTQENARCHSARALAEWARVARQASALLTASPRG